jgi:hypothetical protein
VPVGWIGEIATVFLARRKEGPFQRHNTSSKSRNNGKKGDVFLSSPMLKGDIMDVEAHEAGKQQEKQSGNKKLTHHIL